jgi:hypothetical protein
MVAQRCKCRKDPLFAATRRHCAQSRRRKREHPLHDTLSRLPRGVRRLQYRADVPEELDHLPDEQ